MKAIGLVLILFAGSVGAESLNFDAVNRQNYLKAVLEVFKKSSRQQIENTYQFVNLMERNKCRSSVDALTLTCLRQEVTESCDQPNEKKRQSCSHLSDVVLVNKLNEKQFVTKEERFRMARQTRSSTNPYLLALDKKYGLLTTEMLLLSKVKCDEKNLECLADKIDGYCLHNADVKSLSWQACVSAIVYFIGKSGF